MLIDSHAHLNLEDFPVGIEEVLLRARNAGVEGIINIGTNLKDSSEIIQLADSKSNIYATVGIHPNDNPNETVEDVDWRLFEKLASSPNVVAIGECGLDYSRINNSTISASQPVKNDLGQRANEKNRQHNLFIKQIELAIKLDLPLSLHIRDAQEDLMHMLNRFINIKLRGVFHCFSGDEKYLQFILEKLPGFCISFAGNLTFKNAHQLQNLARIVPSERLLIETDSPFLSPEPFRGKQNEPANARIIAEKLAELQERSFQEIAQITLENTKRLFSL